VERFNRSTILKNKKFYLSGIGMCRVMSNSERGVEKFTRRQPVLELRGAWPPSRNDGPPNSPIFEGPRYPMKGQKKVF
jgi:hypothetical protein